MELSLEKIDSIESEALSRAYREANIDELGSQNDCYIPCNVCASCNVCECMTYGFDE